MSDYFEEVMRKLTIEDVGILGWLFHNEATAVFKAIKKSNVADAVNYSTASFRKTLSKLEAIHFVGTVTGAKEHKLYLTEYGQQAVQQGILEGEDNEEVEEV
ncbi:hypothetical protein [Priestia megaterium]|uniref:hypothetical protein n=1 Tax=Priestia megaterium TaxID=1404 RepID=UPI000BFC58C1|nr:hypothetical protein [Priestia megaterium]PGQ88324.1 hypothetical protein COA18_05185 [Priestia megaterium]